MSNEKDARQEAFAVLVKIQRRGAYSNLALDAALRQGDWDARTSAMTCALVYGCLEHLLTLDYNLARYLRQPLKKLSPEVLTALRIGACQLLFFDKVLPGAAVNSSVSLVKDGKFAFAAGMVNAVLRKIAANGLRLPPEDAPEHLSVRFSVPQWLVTLWTQGYGAEHCRGLLEAMQEPAPLVIRVNTAKTTRAALRQALADEGVEAADDPLTPHGLRLARCGAVEKLKSFGEGLFHVQNSASQLCCALLDAQPGERILDVCAAPGGKSFSLAMDCQNPQNPAESGQVFSCDLYESRLSLITQGVKRLGLTNIICRIADAETENPDFLQEKADKVLCDVPCSGLGILRQKPEIRYKNASDIDKLPDLQYRILCSGSSSLRSGGLLVYSTCALNPAENEQVCGRFLAQHPEFAAVSVPERLPALAPFTQGDAPYVTLMPHIRGCDGFFLAAFRKG